MAPRYDAVTAMDICVDFLVRLGETVPEFGQKEKLVDGYEMELGGSCCIFACQAARLGLRTAGIGVVGDDFFGHLVLDKLRGAGVLTEHLRTDGSIQTGLGTILCKDDGDRAILTYMGTIDALAGGDVRDEILLNSRHLHIGSYYLMKRLQPHYPDIVRKAKKAGLTVSLDTNWDPEETWDSGIWDILPYVDIFLPNENEAKWISRKDTVEEAVDFLRQKVPIVAMKLGKHGACAYAGGNFYKAAPVDVKVVDTVGAGDSFDAGFVYGYLSGHAVEDCLKIGCICGSYNTSRAGGIAGQPGRETMLNVLEGLT